MADKSDDLPDSLPKSNRSSQLADDLARIQESLFPPHVPITDDDEFIEQFGSDPSVPLPEEILDQRWWRKTGQYLYDRALQEAQARHYQEVQKYEALLASVEAENKRIDVENKQLRKKYQEDCVQHQKQLVWHHQREKQRSREHFAASQRWRCYCILSKHYPNIWRGVLWEINKHSIFSPAGLVLMILAAAAGIGRLYLMTVLARYCRHDSSWGVFAASAASVIGCQWCFLLFALVHHHVSRARFGQLVRSKESTSNLVKQLAEWRQMHNRLDLLKCAELAPDFDEFAALFVCRRIRFDETPTIKIIVDPAKRHCVGINEDLDFILRLITEFPHQFARFANFPGMIVHDGIVEVSAPELEFELPGFIVMSLMSVIPIVSLCLFVTVLIHYSAHLFQSKENFVKQIHVYGNTSLEPVERPSWIPWDLPVAPRLVVLPHKSVQLLPPPAFVPPPKPTRPKGDRHV
jgi:hypothetical protein